MRTIRRTSRFKKDIKRLRKQGKAFTEFKKVVEKLTSKQELEPKYQDHKLVGEYKGTRECHLAPDWLLIYELTDDELVLIRTGSHAELFR